MPQQAYKFATTITPQGKVVVDVPLPPGTHVEILVLSDQEDTFTDLAAASSSSLDFWDHPLDDEDWNHA